jgi:hypothetical protein
MHHTNILQTRQQQNITTLCMTTFNYSKHILTEIILKDGKLNCLTDNSCTYFQQINQCILGRVHSNFPFSPKHEAHMLSCGNTKQPQY